MDDQTALLHAVHLAARKLAGSGDFDDVLREVLGICVEAVGARGGTIYLHDPARRTLQFRHVLPPEVASNLKLSDIADDFGVAGEAFQSRKTVISQFDQADETRIAIEGKVGLTTKTETMITVPLMMEREEPIGVVQLVNKKRGVFNEHDAAVLDTISAIATMAYLNSKLLAESTRASQLLGMGKVGHDIKNLTFSLEANLSFSDEAMKSLRSHIDAVGNPVDCVRYAEDIEFMLHELRLSIDRIKRYATLMSDLSAGKALHPVMAVAPLAQTIRLSAAYLESEARSKRVRLVYEIQEDAPPLLHDEMYLFRIVQNLVSNAIKAVGEKDGGNFDFHEEDESNWKKVTVRYRFADRHHILEVEDEGPGMTKETADLILSGNARSAWGYSRGSGWGTKIVLELAATHRAVPSIDSELGKGSVFRLSLPCVDG